MESASRQDTESLGLRKAVSGDTGFPNTEVIIDTTIGSSVWSCLPECLGHMLLWRTMGNATENILVNGLRILLMPLPVPFFFLLAMMVLNDLCQPLHFPQL